MSYLTQAGGVPVNGTALQRSLRQLWERRYLRKPEILKLPFLSPTVSHFGDRIFNQISIVDGIYVKKKRLEYALTPNLAISKCLGQSLSCSEGLVTSLAMVIHFPEHLFL
jgi:hypothetical protein